jgi:hypothetical protein
MQRDTFSGEGRAQKSTKRRFSRAFPTSSRSLLRLPIGSAPSGRGDVMNENVLDVMLHNIIVFNKQIPLSRHLIVQLNGSDLVFLIRARSSLTN